MNYKQNISGNNNSQTAVIDCLTVAKQKALKKDLKRLKLILYVATGLNLVGLTSNAIMFIMG